MSNGPDPPVMPTDALDSGGWALADERTETVFELPTMRVRGVTRRYEDERSREALEAATGDPIEYPVRFFAVTRLVFEPPLPPGVSLAALRPTLRSEAGSTFADRLADRGLTDISRGRSERVSLADRTRVRLRKYTASDPSAPVETELPLECWVGVWTDSGAAFVVTAGYPGRSLASLSPLLPAADGLDRSPAAYRAAFLDLLRETGRLN